MCPVVLVEEPDLTWAQVISFLRVCFQHTLVGVGLETKSPKPEPDMRQDFSAQWPSWPYWVWGLVPNCWNKSPEGWVWAGSILSVCSFSPALLTLPPERSSTSARGARMCIWCGPGYVLGWYQHISSDYSGSASSMSTSNCCPHPIWMLFWVGASSTSQSTLPSAVIALALVWSCTTEQEWPSRHSARAGTVTGAMKETSQNPGQFQSASSTLFPS